MIPVAAGLGVGLAASLALARFLDIPLFQIRARDPVALSAVVILAAIYVPLRRALAVDCTVALREE